MKKIISLILSLMILISLAFTITAFAEDNKPVLDPETEMQIKEDIVEKHNNRIETEDIDLEYYGTLSDGSVLFKYHISGFGYTQVVRDYKISKYVYIAKNGGDYVYVYKDHNFYFLKDAYDNKIIGDKELDEAAQLLNLPLLGDVNEDGRLSVLDATLIQKHLCGYTNPDGTYLIKYDLSDVNGDGEKNILDATQIQKILVQLA